MADSPHKLRNLLSFVSKRLNEPPAETILIISCTTFRATIYTIYITTVHKACASIQLDLYSTPGILSPWTPQTAMLHRP